MHYVFRSQDEITPKRPIPFHLNNPYQLIENVTFKLKGGKGAYFKHPEIFISSANKHSKRKSKQFANQKALKHQSKKDREEFY